LAVTYRALIVDDEPLARERIRDLLKTDAEVQVVGECGDGKAAVAAIQEHRPDLLFLDVQMPKLDGFGVLEAIGPDAMPVAIFVTAYDRYALRAFEVHALDYLLKPFDRERFQEAVQRAKGQLQRQKNGSLNERLVALLEDVKQQKPLERLVIKSAGKVYFLRVEEIDWIEAAGNYLKLHVGEDTHLLREKMGVLEARLDTEQFLRIHRSTIVNVERIQELQPWFHGDYVVVLRGGQQLTLSRSYRHKLHELFGNSI
jgi:two-component system LytT family response regulator